MHGRDVITVIIWIVYKYHIRPVRLKIELVICRYRHVIRVLVPLIIRLSQAPVRIFVKIRNWNHIGVTVRIRLRRLPDTFQRIPHGCFVRKKYRFLPYINVIFNTVFHLDDKLIQIFIYSIGIDIGKCFIAGSHFFDLHAIVSDISILRAAILHIIAMRVIKF